MKYDFTAMKRALFEDQDKVKALHAVLSGVKEALSAVEEVSQQDKELLLTVRTKLGVSQLMRHTLAKNLVVAENNVATLQAWFNEVDKIWKDKVRKLIDHLKVQQREFPYAVVHKLFLSATFGDFMNKCSDTMVNVAITEALVKVKVDYKDVNVPQ